MPNPAEGEKVTIDASGEPKGGAQRRALDIIAAAVVDGTGFVALTGPAGAGKTAVLRAAAELLDHPPIQVIRIDANGAPLTLPRLIGQIAGARQQGDPMARIERAQSRLLRPAAPYERTILMVDDAHELHEDALVYLQLTSRSKVHVERSLQIVFAGEPRFWSLLDNAFLMPLRTRISFRAALDDPTISPDSAHTENAALDSDGNMREDEDIAPSLPSTRPSETSIVASDSALLAGLELIALPRTRGRVRRYGWASLTAMVIVVSAGPNTNETAGLEAVAGPSSPFAELPVISGASRAENQHATVQQSLAMIPGAAPITVGAGDTPVSGTAAAQEAVPVARSEPAGTIPGLPAVVGVVPAPTLPPPAMTSATSADASPQAPDASPPALPAPGTGMQWVGDGRSPPTAAGAPNTEGTLQGTSLKIETAPAALVPAGVAAAPNTESSAPAPQATERQTAAPSATAAAPPASSTPVPPPSDATSADSASKVAPAAEAISAAPMAPTPVANPPASPTPDAGPQAVDDGNAPADRSENHATVAGSSANTETTPAAAPIPLAIAPQAPVPSTTAAAPPPASPSVPLPSAPTSAGSGTEIAPPAMGTSAAAPTARARDASSPAVPASGAGTQGAGDGQLPAIAGSAPDTEKASPAPAASGAAATAKEEPPAPVLPATAPPISPPSTTATSAASAIAEPAVGAAPAGPPNGGAPSTPNPAPAVAPPIAPPPGPSPDVARQSPAPSAHAAATLPPAMVAVMVRRGDEMLRLGDIGAARLLYARAAEAGNGAAAVSAGKTHDPRFLRQIGAQGIVPDPAKAAEWYRRAATLGDHDADRLLAGLEAQSAH